MTTTHGFREDQCEVDQLIQTETAMTSETFFPVIITNDEERAVIPVGFILMKPKEDPLRSNDNLTPLQKHFRGHYTSLPHSHIKLFHR